MIRPIVKIVINGFTINSKTTWDDIHKISKEWNQLWKAMTLYQNSAYEDGA